MLSAQTGWYFFTFISGGLLPILTMVLRFLGTDTNPVGKGLAWFFRLFPAYSFGESLLNIGTKNLYALVELGPG